MVFLGLSQGCFPEAKMPWRSKPSTADGVDTWLARRGVNLLAVIELGLISIVYVGRFCFL